MLRLRMMRAPQKYVQGKDSLLHFHEEMKDLGCLLQLSGNFAAGGFRSNSKRAALKLLENDLVDYIASDAHCVEDYADYRKAIKIAQKY